MEKDKQPIRLEEGGNLVAQGCNTMHYQNGKYIQFQYCSGANMKISGWIQEVGAPEKPQFENLINQVQSKLFNHNQLKNNNLRTNNELSFFGIDIPF